MPSSLLRTHPRTGFSGLPQHLIGLGFDADPPAGGGGDPQPKPGGDPKPKPDDKPPAETDWEAEAKKWEQRAKQFPDLIAARQENDALKAQVEKLAPLEKLAEVLGAKDAKDPSEVDKLTERVTKHEEQLATERAARWRAEVANEKGLTPAQAARLTGATKEELVVDADELLKLFPAPVPDQHRPGYVPQSGGGNGAPAKGSVTAGRDLFKARVGTKNT